MLLRTDEKFLCYLKDNAYTLIFFLFSTAHYLIVLTIHVICDELCKSQA